jgi:hypothetical protein
MIMKVGTAREIAAKWVMQNMSEESWFRGAYFSGSTVGLSRDDELPLASDVDVVVVTAFDDPPLKLGKFVHSGVLIEITYVPWNQLQSADDVLTNYHLAGSFRVNTIFADPTGQLKKLYENVSQRFAEEVWVRQRCEHARQRIETGLKSINTSDPWHDQVTGWLFPTGVTTHVILVAALQNPTVRLRYVKARNVLMEYGYDAVYEELLELLGVWDLSAEQVEGHVDALERTFDAAVSVAKTPFFFSSDITEDSRQIAIDGSRELIRSGFHREAMFWIVATFARCHKIFDADGSEELKTEHAPAFEAVVADLGIRTSEDLIQRAEDVLVYLPKLMEITEAILLDNPNMVRKGYSR